MKTLFLLRHAKSSWETEGQRDFDRPLNPRGRAAAAAMAQHIAAEHIVPDVVLVSPAVRTRQTAQLVHGGQTRWPAPRFVDEIYMASGETLLGLVRAAPPDAASLMLIGHNPGLEDLAFQLINTGAAELRQRLDEKFPTATLCALVFEGDSWEDIASKSATLTQFTRPRDIGQPPEDDD